MKVIWVTPAMPHPAAAGGWAHEFEMIRALADRHEIEVVSSGLGETVGPDALADIGIHVTSVDWQISPYPVGRLRLAAGVLRARPTLNIERKAPRLDAIAEAVRASDERRPADIVHITQQELAPLVTRFRPPTALLLYDSLTREVEGRLAVETSGSADCNSAWNGGAHTRSNGGGIRSPTGSRPSPTSTPPGSSARWRRRSA